MYLIKRNLSIALVIAAIFLLTQQSVEALQSAFRVVSTGNDFTEIEFKLTDHEFITNQVDEIDYQRIFHPEALPLMETGMPELPIFSFSLAVPDVGKVVLQEVNVIDRELVTDIDIFPSQGMELEIDPEKGFIKNEGFYTKDLLYPNYISQATEPSIMRDYRFISVNVLPFRYNPANRELEVNKHLRIRIEYDKSATGVNEIIGQQRRISKSFENLYRSTFLNYDEFRDPSDAYQERSIMVVYHHNATLLPFVEQFIDWKRDKGFLVHGVNTQNLTNATAIKNYVQNAYNNWVNPPEYLVIVGSYEDGTEVSTFHRIDNSPGDHPYSLLAGNDDISDIFVGRISVRNHSEFMTVWNKIRNYERVPYMAETDWYNHALLAGAMNTWGISTIYTNKYVKEIMLRHSDSYEFTEVYNPPFSQPINDALNQGVNVFSFRGYYSLQSWNMTDMNTGFKLPNAVFVTCHTLWPLNNNHTEVMVRRGTATTPNGGVTAIGMTSDGTATGPNNAITGGIYYGIFKDQMRTMGEALVRGKVYLHQVYSIVHPTIAPSFSHWANLIGDPSMDIWVEVPKTLAVEHLDQIPLGTNSIEVRVTDGDGMPLENSWVSIRKGDDVIRAVDYTNEQGMAVIFFDSSEENGSVKLTVTKPDYKPYLGNFQLTEEAAILMTDIVWSEEPIAGTTPEFVVFAKNNSDESFTAVTGTISIESSYLTIVNNSASFGNFSAGETKDSAEPFSINIDPATPSGWREVVKLTLQDNAGNEWISRFEVVVQNASLRIESVEINGNPTGFVNPGEQAFLNVTLRNVGNVSVDNLYAELRGTTGVTVIQNEAFFGNLTPNQTGNNTGSEFSVSLSELMIPGMSPELELYLYNNSEFEQKRAIKIPVGQVTVDDPYGPDAYGYWVYDIGDTGYTNTPTYDWIEIVPNYGGYGVNLEIKSDFNDLQEFKVIDLPFTFKFYGIEYDQITVCANGWMSFGESEMGTARNWRIPGALGPNALVAPFWDNLSIGSTATDGVFMYHDVENHRFILQWQNARTLLQNLENTFQIILYDPDHYVTNTGDGPIKMQYKVFNNVNTSPGGYGPGNYATVGIGDHTGLIGLEYSFANTYPTAARPLGNETAIYFTTSSPYDPFIIFQDYQVLESEINRPVYGEVSNVTITLKNQGSEQAENVIGRLSTTSEYVTILDNEVSFGNMVEDQTVTSGDFTIELSDNIPPYEPIQFEIEIRASHNLSWNQRFSMPVSAPYLTTTTPIIYDPAPNGNENGVIDPGETLTVFLPIKNVGMVNSEDLTLSVVGQAPLVIVNTISATEFTGVKAGETIYPALNVSVATGATVNMSISFEYTIESGSYVFNGKAYVGVGGTVYSQLGSGGQINSATTQNPINIYNRSLRSQMVYTVEEIRAAGYYGNEEIKKFGFYVVSPPNHPLPNFIIRMKHTGAVDATNHDQGPFTTVYNNLSYNPTAGQWDMLTLDTPFVWNGVDNLRIDTAFSVTTNWSQSGRQRVYIQENGYRYGGSDALDQTNMMTMNVSQFKPQVMLAIDTKLGVGGVVNPTGLTAEQIDETIMLSWYEPETAGSQRAVQQNRLTTRNSDSILSTREFLGYNVYRNGLKINSEIVVVNEYIDSEVETDKEYFFYVTAVYEQGESRPSNVVNHFFSLNAAIPQIYPESGVFYEPFEVSLTSQTVGAEIYYTLDGSEPDQSDLVYSEPFEIDYHTVVRARAYHEGLSESEIKTAQYYILYSARDLTVQGLVNQADLQWVEPWSPDQNSDVTGYDIYRKESSEDEIIKINPSLVTEIEYIDSDLNAGVYEYYVVAVYEQGESQPSEAVEVTVTGVSVDDDFYQVTVTELLNAYPNPFNPETTIQFTLKESGFVTIDVFNISGKRVKVLVNEERDAGRHSLVWRGDNNDGRRLSSGIYFYRMRTENHQDIKKLIMLK